MIEIYCKPGCVQCEYTEKKLSQWGVPHNCIDITQNVTAMNTVLASGNMQMPYVVAGDDSWHGFQYDKLKDLANQIVPAYGPLKPQDLPDVSCSQPLADYL